MENAIGGGYKPGDGEFSQAGARSSSAASASKASPKYKQVKIGDQTFISSGGRLYNLVVYKDGAQVKIDSAIQSKINKMAVPLLRRYNPKPTDVRAPDHPSVQVRNSTQMANARVQDLGKQILYNRLKAIVTRFTDEKQPVHHARSPIAKQIKVRDTANRVTRTTTPRLCANRRARDLSSSSRSRNPESPRKVKAARLEDSAVPEIAKKRARQPFFLRLVRAPKAKSTEHPSAEEKVRDENQAPSENERAAVATPPVASASKKRAFKAPTRSLGTMATQLGRSVSHLRQRALYRARTRLQLPVTHEGQIYMSLKDKHLHNKFKNSTPEEISSFIEEIELSGSENVSLTVRAGKEFMRSGRLDLADVMQQLQEKSIELKLRRAFLAGVMKAAIPATIGAITHLFQTQGHNRLKGIESMNNGLFQLDILLHGVVKLGVLDLKQLGDEDLSLFINNLTNDVFDGSSEMIFDKLMTVAKAGGATPERDIRVDDLMCRLFRSQCEPNRLVIQKLYNNLPPEGKERFPGLGAFVEVTSEIPQFIRNFDDTNLIRYYNELGNKFKEDLLKQALFANPEDLAFFDRMLTVIPGNEGELKSDAGPAGTRHHIDNILLKIIEKAAAKSASESDRRASQLIMDRFQRLPAEQKMRLPNLFNKAGMAPQEPFPL